MNPSRRSALLILPTTVFFLSCQTVSHGPTGPGFPSTIGNPVGGGVPTTYTIYPPYPNPFNQTTAIRIAIPRASDVLLVAQNPVGDVVETLISQPLSAGQYIVTWDASKGGTRDLKAGFYFITLHAGDFTGSRVAKLEK